MPWAGRWAGRPRAGPEHSVRDGSREPAPGGEPPPRCGGPVQNAASGSSITELSTVSASARWVVTSGSTLRAKNFAAAILPV